MKKMSTLLLAATLVVTAAAGVGCSSGKQAASTEAKKDDSQAQRTAYAAVLLAEDRFQGMFEAKQGLEGGKEVAFYVPNKSQEAAIEFLSTSWDKEVAKKEFEAVLGDKALLDKANKAFEEKAKADKKEFKPVAAVAVKEKIGANAINGAKFEDVKISEKDGKFVIEYKGLKYTLTKNGESYKIVGKEGQLQK
ncbi:hypothetical protein [Effusibacillus lacus]|uniref:Lipoprotein n=1 Tax=Effusibacillus lacus TaxID=1348429 RepID=A0A292YGA5_9BACL|nr:hypothetical protein [Effusibacillus lacus]TCS73621.1 hypothetical protein EDD64_11734 [Effusibacillus lacus]GAX89487.1 hypothetical protein [Effusibacillus lacus]